MYRHLGFRTFKANQIHALGTCDPFRNRTAQNKQNIKCLPDQKKSEIKARYYFLYFYIFLKSDFFGRRNYLNGPEYAMACHLGITVRKA